MTQNPSLKGKVALITGAGRGIGEACARLFAEQGASVILASRSEAELYRVAESIQAEFGEERALAVPTDVGEEESILNLFRRALETFGPIDILVNNAATIEVIDFIDLETSLWDQLMAVNLRGAFICSREAFRQMAKSGRGGSIIQLSSLSGIRGTEKFPGFSAYTVSKHGIVGLTESLAVEGKALNIRVNCIAPGAVETAMLKKAAPFLKTSTMPMDIAKIALFLADENQASSLNGAVIEVHSNE